MLIILKKVIYTFLLLRINNGVIMAIIKKHSFDEKKIKKYRFYNNQPLIELKNENDYLSYLKAVREGVCFDYNGINCLICRIRSDIIAASQRTK